MEDEWRKRRRREGEYPSSCPRRETGKRERKGVIEGGKVSEKEHVRDAESVIIKGKQERQEKMRAEEKNRKQPGVEEEERAGWHREKSE